MNKRGVFFTLTAIALFLVLLFLSNSYLDRAKDVEISFNNNILADQVNFIEDSIVYEYYNKIIDLKPGNIDRLGEGQVEINFPDAGHIPNLENKTELARIYKEYMEGRFSDLSNANVTLVNFYPNFTIIPYNSVFMKEGNELIFYNFNHSLLKKITIELQADKGADDVEGTSVPLSTGDSEDVEIKLKVKGKGGKKPGSGEEIIEEEVFLDPTVQNSFIVDFEEDKELRVDFGDFNGHYGTFITRVNGLTANITLFQVRYKSVNETVKAIGGNFSIDKLGIEKNNVLVIASE